MGLKLIVKFPPLAQACLHMLNGVRSPLRNNSLVNRGIVEKRVSLYRD